MNSRINAVYEDGVLKPLSPLRNIEEHSRVVITVEAVSAVEQFRGLVRIDPAIAAEIIDSADYGMLE